MMKKFLYLTTAVFAFFLISTSMGLASEKGEAEYVLKSTVDAAAKPKPALFPHAKHQAVLQCGDCHHAKGADGKMVPYTEGQKIEKCQSCHNKAAGMPKGLETFKDVAHKLCKECHKSMTAEGKKTGPTKCNGCHVKDLK